MVGDAHVLTASHVLHWHGSGGTATDVLFTTAQNGEGNVPYGTFKATKFFTHERWRDHKDFDFDFGIIKLSAQPGVGYLGIFLATDQILQGRKFRLAAYPSDKGTYEMWTSEDGINNVEMERFCYRIDTTAGTSGGGLFTHLAGWGHGIVGVNIYEAPCQNCACRISQNKLDRIHQWMLS
jgi:V8-like Glu-specific endopeptidase